MNKEFHPHLGQFDSAKAWKYLIIGTFPPNTTIREKFYIDYFYGNKGFLWKIIHDIYHTKGYDFFGGSPSENLAQIKKWQQDYCIGLSDTILSCTRTHPLASDDSSLRDVELNLPLKEYVLRHASHLEKIIFTSSFAYQNFKKIMNGQLEIIQSKLVTDLPSPSGAGNISFVNTSKANFLGLTEDIYHYIVTEQPAMIPEFEKRWEIKKSKIQLGKNSGIIIPPVPAGIVKAYKTWKYEQVLPAMKCV